MIEAVFFDLYETLITEWKDNKKKADYSISELGIEEIRFKKEWDARREKRMNGIYPDFQSVLMDILSGIGSVVDLMVIDLIYQKRVHAKTVPFKDIDKEIIQMISAIKMSGIKIGLISNCAPEEVTAWNVCPLSRLFDDVVFSYNVGWSKPNPEIYLSACKNLGVSPERSLFIGDGGSDELLGASKIGMNAYHATWFQPAWISKKITGFHKLKNPLELIEIIKGTV